MIKERRTGKDFEGRRHGLIGVLSGHSPGMTEQNNENTIRTAGLPAKTPNGQLPNSNLERLH
jgi:hypothetical protein